MTPCMAKRPTKVEPMAPSEPPQEKGQSRNRLIIDTDDVIHRAIELRAVTMSSKARRLVGKSEAVNSILRDALTKEVQEAEREMGRS